MKVIFMFVSLIVVIKAGYHEEAKVPMAAKVKPAGENLTDKVPEMESRMLDSELAPVGAHPYVVGLILATPTRESKTHVCGSSLVSATRLVTAAHCLYEVTSIEAVFGSLSLDQGGMRVTTNVFTVHPNYDQSRSYVYDIGVVVLPEPVQFTDLIQPISLPTPEDAGVVGEWAVTAGWGITNPKQLLVEHDAQLLQTRVQIVSDDVCQQSYDSDFVPGHSICTSGAAEGSPCSGDSGGPLVVERNGQKVLVSIELNPPKVDNFVSGNSICTSGAAEGSPCSGDSGGPLVIERNGQKVLIGLTSYGPVPCDKTIPTLFTRVSNYLQFIQQNL